MQVAAQPWMQILGIPQPPAPPRLPTASTSPQPPAPATDAPGETAAAPPQESIGVSPVVQAFLLRLQELGMTSLPGTDGNDTLSGWSGSLADAGSGDDSVDVWSDSVVDGGDGNDSIRAWSNSAVYGGNGDDQLDVWSGSVVDGGAGDDVIRAWSDTAVQGGDGNDQINAWSNSVVDGGDGDDVIQAHVGSIVSGGRGNDMVALRGNSILRFEAGDGQDTLYAGADTTVQLGQGLAAGTTKVEVSGNTATIRFDGGSDSLTVHLDWRSPLTLSFADGSSLSVAAEGEIIKPELHPGQVHLREAAPEIMQQE